MPSPLHDQLTDLGVRWLKRQGFGLVASELVTAGGEIPDVIGFRSHCSAIVEVKVSRSDFLADARKLSRQGLQPGLGLYRFYLCPEGLITPDDLPAQPAAQWGLLYAQGARIREILRPQGNLWPGPGAGAGHWAPYQHALDESGERRMLYSLGRRLALGESILRHTP